MGKSAWYQVDTSRVYAASPAPPKEPIPDGDEWLDDYKPRDWQAQNDELDEQMRTIHVGDGLAQWDLDDEALNAVESLGKGPASFVIPRNVDPNPSSRVSRRDAPLPGGAGAGVVIEVDS